MNLCFSDISDDQCIPPKKIVTFRFNDFNDLAELVTISVFLILGLHRVFSNDYNVLGDLVYSVTIESVPVYIKPI